MVQAVLEEKLKSIFGCTIEKNKEDKVEKLVQTFKYNTIVQNLAPVSADNYKKYRIADSIALQQMNCILELALGNAKSAKVSDEVFNELGAGIHDEDLIRWYGTNASFYYMPDGLCRPILKTLMQKSIENMPQTVITRIEEFMLKRNDEDGLSRVMDYDLIVARFYECALALGSLTLNHPDDYLVRYREEYYLTDQLYRLSVENFYKIPPTAELYDDIQQVKLNLDRNYAKLCNRINLEWMRCIKDAGGMGALHGLRQQDFYDKRIKEIQKKVVVIVSDALRYEVAQEQCIGGPQAHRTS